MNVWNLRQPRDGRVADCVGRGRPPRISALGFLAVVALSLLPVTAQGRALQGSITSSPAAGAAVTSGRQPLDGDGSLEGTRRGFAAACGCSQNGWPASADPAAIGVRAFTVPGSSVSLRVKAGDVSTVLLYVASRFHREIEPLQQAQSAGYNYRVIAGSSVYSNHASGTAVDLNWTEHPQKATGTFTAAQEAVIRDILAATGGVVRWGGDYNTTPDEMHFEINVPPGDARLARVAASLNVPAAPRGWTSIVSSDLDGDGDDEVGFYRQVDGLLQWYEMTATGGLGTRLGTSTLSPTWTSIVSADLDGNGDDEVGFYRTSDGTTVWYPMTATGGLGTRLGTSTLSPTWTSVASADLDGNGKDEVGFYRKTDGTTQWYRTTSTGALGARLSPTGYTLAPVWTQVLGSDFDGDADDELAFYRDTDGQWVVYEGATDGTLGTRLYLSDLYP